MIQEDDRTLEQSYRSAVRGLYARLRSNYDFLYRKFGEEGLKLIAEMSHEYGLEVARRAKTKVISKDIASVGEYLLRIFDTVGRGLDIIPTVEEQGNRLIIRVNRCPLGFDMPAMCRAHTTMEKTVVEELNPELIYRIGKSIPDGDSCCEHILEIRK
jgi:hypothetical protein